MDDGVVKMIMIVTRDDIKNFVQDITTICVEDFRINHESVHIAKSIIYIDQDNLQYKILKDQAYKDLIGDLKNLPEEFARLLYPINDSDWILGIAEEMEDKDLKLLLQQKIFERL